VLQSVLWEWPQHASGNMGNIRRCGRRGSTVLAGEICGLRGTRHKPIIMLTALFICVTWEWRWIWMRACTFYGGDVRLADAAVGMLQARVRPQKTRKRLNLNGTVIQIFKWTCAPVVLDWESRELAGIALDPTRSLCPSRRWWRVEPGELAA